ncbi:MAG: NAD(P)-dependent oxidoreductase [Spirochaetales bacterium]
MRLMVFGATGRTGQPFVRQALANGHTVTALVRNAVKIPTDIREKITVIEGNVMSSTDVAHAVGKSNADAVVSTLGPVKGSPDDLMTKAADSIVAAMKEHSVSRLVWMTGAGVPGDGDQPKFMDHVVKGLLKLLAGKVLVQSEHAAETVRNSGLEWTIVRAPMLTDAEPSGSYRVGRVGVGTGAKLIRADGAAYILTLVENGEEIGKSPVVSN